jgi:FkbM family methyltransferase
MRLHQNTLFGYKYCHWTFCETFLYFIKGVARELNIAPNYFLKKYEKAAAKSFKKKWLKKDGTRSYFDIKGAKLPDISDQHEKLRTFVQFIFDDIFLVSYSFNENYSKAIVEFIEPYMIEGPYGYVDNAFDVTVKKGDIVIDAGAWIGDYSAYAASKGATVYAFEPVQETFELLSQTSVLNNNLIIPIQKGLGVRVEDIEISINKDSSASNSTLYNVGIKETISITTLDKFVEENGLKKVDFIKADIEGAERDMLRGATNVLKTFAPKLAICTYHLPDDPEILEQIIKEANPNYTVVHLRKKLLAAVI